jgi:hypothetical protein
MLSHVMSDEAMQLGNAETSGNANVIDATETKIGPVSNSLGGQALRHKQN